MKWLKNLFFQVVRSAVTNAFKQATSDPIGTAIDPKRAAVEAAINTIAQHGARNRETDFSLVGATGLSNYGRLYEAICYFRANHFSISIYSGVRKRMFRMSD